MAHLDTAYKLGSLQAQVDFEQEIQKLAQDDILPTSPISTPSRAALQAQTAPAKARGPAPLAPLQKATEAGVGYTGGLATRGSPAEAVRGTGGLALSPNTATRAQMTSTPSSAQAYIGPGAIVNRGATPAATPAATPGTKAPLFARR